MNSDRCQTKEINEKRLTKAEKISQLTWGAASKQNQGKGGAVKTWLENSNNENWAISYSKPTRVAETGKNERKAGGRPWHVNADNGEKKDVANF